MLLIGISIRIGKIPMALLVKDTIVSKLLSASAVLDLMQRPIVGVRMRFGLAIVVGLKLVLFIC